LVGITVLALCLWHGATFLTIRSTGVVLQRAVSLKERLSLPATLLVIIYAVCTYLTVRPGAGGIIALAIPVLAVLAAFALARGARGGGRAFAATAVAIGGVIAAIFANLYPAVMISTEDAYTLTVENSTASSYSLTVMTIVAAVMVPLVLAYQGWTYYVFRARVKGPAAPPVVEQTPAG